MFAGLILVIAYVIGLVALAAGGEWLGALALAVPGLLVAAFIRSEWNAGG